MLYTYLWLRHQVERLADERGSIFGEYGFLFVAVAIAALAGLMILGGNLRDYFGTTIAGYFGGP